MSAGTGAFDFYIRLAAYKVSGFFEKQTPWIVKEQKLNARQTQTALGRFVIFVQTVFVHIENEDLRVSHGYIVYVGHGLRLILTGLFLIAMSIMLE